MNQVYIVAMARTPIGSFGGSLSKLSAVEMGTMAVKEVVKRAGIEPTMVNEIFMGNVLSANTGQAPTRQVALAAGLGDDTPSTTINKVCASGMKAVMLATQSIRLGDADIVVAGGMESMSNAPFYLTKSRWGNKYGHMQTLDAIMRDGLQDPYNGSMMGNCGEICAKGYNFSREDQDAYATESYKRAIAAQENNWYANEIMPIEIPGRRGKVSIVAKDDEPGNIRWEKVATLRPAFEKDGTITAVNASKINDGAAAMVLVSEAKMNELGLKPIAKVLSYADAGQTPDWFTTTPSKAMPKAIAKAQLTIKDIDLFEINEAFSVVALANMKELNISHEQTNVLGGAVSLGHPIGVSGTRILCTLISALQLKNKKYGCAGICNGGGGASAMVIEKL